MKMNYSKIETEQIHNLWQLQLAYKEEIGEEQPPMEAIDRLTVAMQEGSIEFYGAWDDNKLVGCCSISKGFSTFNYGISGVFEDFYILPGYRHKGIARELVHFAYENSGVESLTVGCADCDLEMYGKIGFTIKLGNLLAFK
ncbi:MAG: GNAT family N-acetyltransferase [Treponema sp.]|nr:GNAT family N-acetyltransferase [Candidatus Treponema caballi]